MEEFIAFILFIIGVLGIILFFKIWGATNDLKVIRKNTTSTRFSTDIVQRAALLIALGRVEEAKTSLDDDLHKTLQSIILDKSLQKEYGIGQYWRQEVKSRWKMTIDNAEKVYSHIGYEIPKEYKDFDFKTYFKVLYGKDVKDSNNDSENAIESFK